MKKIKNSISVFLFMAFGDYSQAQIHAPPNVGQLLNRNEVVLSGPDKTNLYLPEHNNAVLLDNSGGDDKSRVLIRFVKIEGIPDEKLNSFLEMDELYFNNPELLNIDELRNIAKKVERKLRERGFIFANAWLPAQDLTDGILSVSVELGRYGLLQTESRLNTSIVDKAVEEVQRWVNVLEVGAVIEKNSLHRRLMLLSDLPGLQTSSILRKGDLNGRSDLIVNVDSFKKWHADISFDNYGNSYAGKERVSSGIYLNSTLVFGDTIRIKALRTTEETLQTDLFYGFPLGLDGLRLNTQLGNSKYKLGKEFSSLKAHGSSENYYIGIGYPLIKNSNFNIQADLGFQHRSMRDIRDAVAIDEIKKSKSIKSNIVSNIKSDKSISLLGIGWVVGNINLSDKQINIDQMSARTSGNFHRLTVDAIHLHTFGRKWSAFLRASGQWSNKNLDDSEKISLGGAYGIRGWPSGEAIGDQGFLSQIESRFRVYKSWETYAFVDAGSVQINHSPWSNSSNRRNIYSKGMGVRYEETPLKLDFSWAMRNGKSNPTSYPSSNKNIILLSASYYFE